MIEERDLATTGTVALGDNEPVEGGIEFNGIFHAKRS